MSTKRLYRSTTNRVLAGVCGGIADYFGIDAVGVRIVVVILAVLTKALPILLAYIVAALLIPTHPVRGGTHAATASTDTPVRDAEVEEKK